MYPMPYTQPHHMNHETSQGVFSPAPSACHGCCSYGFTPAYYNQPYPYYHPPHMPFYYYGPCYSSFPPMYNSLPPHYPIDQHRYEFDKSQLTGHQCCGCFGTQSNNKKEYPHVKFEQQEPTIENTCTNNSRGHNDSNGPEFKQNDQYPCDLNSENNVNQNQMEGEKNNLPFPLFWVPYKASEEGKDYEGDKSVIGAQGNEDKVGTEFGQEEMGKKNKIRKLIPVKQVGDNEEKRGKEIVKEKGDRDKKITKSKLPPVCLRVEPLRKRKNGSNENSRSPSPRRDENKSSSCARNEKNEIQLIEGERKAIELDGKTKENIEENKEIRAVEANESVVTNKIDKEETSILEKIEKGEINMLEKNKMEKENCKINEARKKLSEVEAAVMIQCAYRGFEVRRWDPLKKLRQIGEISEKVAEIRSKIEALEASSDKKESDDKQRVVIGETIMGLLLKLDTIQGLCPSVREIRKSVAKELVNLQEKLDSLANESSKSFTVELVEDLTEGQDEAEVGPDNNVVAPHAEIQPVSYLCKSNDEKNGSSVATTTNDSEPILKEMCEELQDGDYKSPSIHEIDTHVDIAIAKELQESIDDEIKHEIDIESDDQYMVEQEHRRIDDYSEKHKLSVQVQENDQEGQNAKIVYDMNRVDEEPKPEEIHSEEEKIRIPEDMKQNLELAEENQDLLENKNVVEIKNVEENKNIETVEMGSDEKKLEIGGEIEFESEKKLVEENENLREMVAKLVEAGKEQLSVISSLSNRVKELEMKLGKKKNPKMRRIRVKSSC